MSNKKPIRINLTVSEGQPELMADLARLNGKKLPERVRYLANLGLMYLTQQQHSGLKTFTETPSAVPQKQPVSSEQDKIDARLGDNKSSEALCEDKLKATTSTLLSSLGIKRN